MAPGSLSRSFASLHLPGAKAVVVILNRELICALGCFENAALGFTGAEGTWGGELGVGVTSVPVVVLTPITSGSVCRKIVSSELIYLPPRKQKRKPLI